MKKKLNPPFMPEKDIRFIGREEAISLFFDSYESKKKDILNGVKSLSVVEYSGANFIGKTQLIKKIAQLLEEEKRALFYEYNAEWDGVYPDKLAVLNHLKLNLQSKYGFKFPIFDKALKRINEFEGGQMYSNSFSSNVTELTKIIGPITSSSGIVVALAATKMAYKLGAVAWKFYRERKTDYYKLIETQDPIEVKSVIQTYFAIDLNENMEKYDKPMIIFIDGFEKLFKSNPSPFFPDGGWLINVPEDSGFSVNRGLFYDTPKVIWVLATNEKIKWSKNWGAHSILKYTLNDFSYDETENFLTAYGIAEEMQKCLYRLTRGTPGYLSICVKTYNAIKEKGNVPTSDDFGENIEELLEKYFSKMSSTKMEILFLLALLGTWDEVTLESIDPFGYFGRENSDYQELLDKTLISEKNDIFTFHQTPRNAALKLLDKVKYTKTKQKIINNIMNECVKRVAEDKISNHDSYMMVSWASTIMIRKDHVLPEGEFMYFFDSVVETTIKNSVIHGGVGRALVLCSELLKCSRENYCADVGKRIEILFNEILSYSSAVQALYNKNNFSLNYLKEFAKDEPFFGQIGVLMEKKVNATSTQNSELLVMDAEEICEVCIEEYGVNSLEVANALLYLGNCYMFIGNPLHAITKIEKAIKIHEDHFGLFSEAVLNDNMFLSDAYAVAENYLEFKRSIENEYKLAISLHDTKLTNQFLFLYHVRTALAKLTLEEEWKEDYEFAKKYFFKLSNKDIAVILFADAINILQAELLENSVDEIEEKRECENAIIINEKIMECLEILGGTEVNKFLIGTVLLVLYDHIERYDSAIEIGKKNLELAIHAIGDSGIEIFTQKELGRCYFDAGRLKEANTHLKVVWKKCVNNSEVTGEKIDILTMLLQSSSKDINEFRRVFHWSLNIMTEELNVSKRVSKFIEKNVTIMIDNNCLDGTMPLMEQALKVAFLHDRCGGHCEWMEFIISLEEYSPYFDLDEFKEMAVIEIFSELEKMQSESLLDFKEGEGDPNLTFNYCDDLFKDIEIFYDAFNESRNVDKKYEHILDWMDALKERYGVHEDSNVEHEPFNS